MIRPYRGIQPQIHPEAYIDPAAQIIGKVTVGARSSIWPSAVARGDIANISVGEETSIQDGTVLHCDFGMDLVIGSQVTVGHLAMLHGCTIEDGCLIGIGAIVLNRAHIGRGSIIAAGALVAEGKVIPPGSMVMGVPGKIVRPVTPEEQQRTLENAQHYVDRAREYKADA
ncbi:MAG: gamma carbonic anhydrase family protein [Bryobacteraceae bacterium]|nr:gamma carbonic anhydrase family protein [Bryobacteraceae bacterium]